MCWTEVKGKNGKHIYICYFKRESIRAKMAWLSLVHVSLVISNSSIAHGPFNWQGRGGKPQLENEQTLKTLRLRTAASKILRKVWAKCGRCSMSSQKTWTAALLKSGRMKNWNASHWCYMREGCKKRRVSAVRPCRRQKKLTRQTTSETCPIFSDMAHIG